MLNPPIIFIDDRYFHDREREREVIFNEDNV